MDGSLEHSDSDSGESWTILDDGVAIADEAPDYPDSPARGDGEVADNNEKDEDTDGISIISDSDHESTTPYEHITYPAHDPESDDRPTETHIPKYVLANPLSPNSPREHNHESIKADDDFLMDNTGKLKTYVHRRNKRLSTVLNIIVLGSIITAAGVAIGHMWGVKDDCTLQSTQSVNKILSNLYKLQEENAYLRSKLKELTLISNLQQRKTDSLKLSPKHLKCKKVFEEPLNSKNVDKLTKCVEFDNSKTDKILESHLLEPEYEKDFLSDIEKLKNVYRQNKSWLDDEVARRLRDEELSQKRLKFKFQSGKLLKVNKSLKDEKLERQLEAAIHEETQNNNIDPIEVEPVKTVENNLRKVSYADSLKSDKDGSTRKTIHKRDIDAVSEGNLKDYIRKKKPKKEQLDTVSEMSSDEELIKDDRYSGPKQKIERKKNDRHKSSKRQKRRNKYEQWEMKGGYMKDYDEFSTSSAQENDFVLKNPDKNYLSRDFERKNYIEQFSETGDNVKSETDNVPRNDNKSEKKSSKNEKENRKQKVEKETDWYDRRAAIRSEARKKLEKELFGEITPNNAAWYFRRMQKREQCRVKADNSTRRKTYKNNMNFKTKH